MIKNNDDRGNDGGNDIWHIEIKDEEMVRLMLEVIKMVGVMILVGDNGGWSY